ncbi:response regulator transcription factor [Actinoplanes derwentensis]|uniref:DNA-binding response regulator, OmpR family, contains REC and winged-helix (WHTH) domain n=1 Tax=Actinoplanes derwentensis TaxID=113562 RepID=A0A1H1RIV5_9ACTN|nr:response regulator transcription factor [Actinoplanes derwentensis]GID84437.1 DNA-binding response regulator [Actinoplanes derwentensis]SDS35661.1 DNA-binding response regulator, OmpR family, contains REC and winged-helix (wHTH) domain [Actinoplanes derwentensis]
MPERILIAEDDPRQAEIVRRYLQAAGWDPVVVTDGRAAITAVRQRMPDLLVLDVLMPEIDGRDVCRVLRVDHDLPILMLTARSSADDRVQGLELGADDYLTKPYDPRELVARVRSLLRRAAARPPAETGLRVGALTVDTAGHTVKINDTTISCTRGEFAILAVLAAEPGRVFSRRQLVERISGLDRNATDRGIDMHVSNLRRKLDPGFLVTVHGVGYKLVDGALG